MAKGNFSTVLKFVRTVSVFVANLLILPHSKKNIILSTLLNFYKSVTVKNTNYLGVLTHTSCEAHPRTVGGAVRIYC